MKKFALKVYMKICERRLPLLRTIRETREQYEISLHEFMHSKHDSVLHGLSITTANNAHKKLRELNKVAAQKISEKRLKKYQKALDKYIFICYNKDTKNKEI